MKKPEASQSDPVCSVIIPVYNEATYMVACMESILQQTLFQSAQVEVLFVDGNSQDNTRDIIQTYCDKYANIRLIRNEKRFVPFAMNMGIRAATAPIIIRMDAHCIYPNHYLAYLLAWKAKLKADNVGTVIATKPANDSLEALAVSIVSSHKFGVGNSYFRVGTDRVREVDTVPFGCYDRAIFDQIGLYDEALLRNQDDELNARLIKAGGRIFLLPELVLTYFARAKLHQLYRMYYQYGLYKPLVLRKIGRPATWRQLVPLSFVLALIGTGLISFLHPLGWMAFVSIWILYIGVSSLISFRLAWQREHGIRAGLLFVYLLLGFLSLHLSYGLGYLRGIFQFLILVPASSISAKSSR